MRPAPPKVTTLSKWFDAADKIFFQKYPDRFSHIRKPHSDECQGEFWSLGDHDRKRRRIILWRVPPDNAFYDATGVRMHTFPLTPARVLAALRSAAAKTQTA